MFVVRVGLSRYESEQLPQIASNPRAVLKPSSFKALSNMASEVMRRVCGEGRDYDIYKVAQM